MIDYAEALQRMLACATVLPEEVIPLEHADGRVLACDVVSPQCLPPFDNSAMDGFALRCAGIPLAAGTALDVEGWQAAGDAVSQGGQGAWEIMTGARMPDGLDSVIPVEQVRVLLASNGRPQRIELLQAVTPGQFVRLRGQDVSTRQVLLAAGSLVTLNACTLLHATGVDRMVVRAQPRVAVITTGRELVSDAATALGAGQIRDSNRPYLIGRLRAAGAAVVWHGVVGDDESAFGIALQAALDAGAQLVISSGAVSQGRYDFIPDALRARGATLHFHKVAIRPGKPLLFAQLPGGALIFGLPGNPVSAAVGQRFFVEPVLRRMLGLEPEPALQVPLYADAPKPPGLRFHARARVELDAQGQLSARILAGQESFRLMSTLQANAWVVLEADDAGIARAGTPVQVSGWGHGEPIQLVSAREVS
jgi:molybdopterin molybdotransferase